MVQGVGFRPFVYRLAQELGIGGYVLNSGAGVVVEAEGAARSIDILLERLRCDAPPLAVIASISVADIAPRGHQGFSIVESDLQTDDFGQVSPDVAICSDCRREILDPGDRRYRYPFTTCTNCGPRFTIIRSLPFDRATTTMAAFQMCARCDAEYRRPADRRFHAEGNACAQCGPGVALVAAGGEVPAAFTRMAAPVLTDVTRLLREGAIVAIRGLGGFHLACDATSDAAVGLLRRRKRRPEKPLALMVRDEFVAARIADISGAERKLMAGREHPIVTVPRKDRSVISNAVAPGSNTVGLMLPYTPLHVLLFDEGLEALVMTSGNISEEPIAASNAEALDRLGNVADWFLLHDREIHIPIDDSVAHLIDGQPRVTRRARSYAPQALDLGTPVTEILACGAELKNTFCLTKDRSAILSPHIGDLSNYETLTTFERLLGHLRKLHRITPQAVAHDLHPLYISTRYAKQCGLPAVGVQHHHAHIASCMAENGVRERVIGVAMDGTGFGLDGRIWGGEFFAGDLGHFDRVAHLRYVPLAGGDAAIREPWRVAISYWRDAFGDRPLALPVQQARRQLVETMLDRRFNVVDTSSCGRLFDAVASMLGVRHEVTFEAQAAIELESIADRSLDDEGYPVVIDDSADPWQIDFRPAIHHIMLERDAHIASARFHNTVAAMIVEVCSRIRATRGLDRVCLSGGVFQNVLLTERTVARLRKRQFDVMLHSAVPCNDGGISLGQAVIANERILRGDIDVPCHPRSDR